MVDVAYLSKLYAEKLLSTGSHQDAFLKAVWVAYKEGIKDGQEPKQDLFTCTQDV